MRRIVIGATTFAFVLAAPPGAVIVLLCGLVVALIWRKRSLFWSPNSRANR